MTGTADISATALEDWTAEYRGVIVGSPDSALTFTEIAGLLDAPGVRVTDRRTLGRHGEVSGRDYLGSRTVTLTVEVDGRDETEFAERLQALSRAFAPTRDAAPFTFRFPGVAGGGIRYVTAKVRKRAAVLDWAFTHNYATVTIELYCSSPLINDVVTSSAKATLPTTTATNGIVFPRAFPVAFGSPVDASVVRVLNAGDFDTFPRFRISGPVSFPRIVNLDTGEQIEFQYTLISGQWLDVDTETREVLLNGSAPRFLTPGKRNTWLTARPGLTEFGFRGFPIPGEPGVPELTVTWSSAWV